MRAPGILLAIALAGCGAEPPSEDVSACVDRATRIAGKKPDGLRISSIVFTYDVTGFPGDRLRPLLEKGIEGSGPATMHSFSGATRGVAADFIARHDTSKPALLIAYRSLYQLQRPIVGDVAGAIRKGCALLAPEGHVVDIRMNL
ncbi:hypothetical protein SAMN06297144_2207 [Sphingomonas guangdongensis]|uniref:Uncharacterized protein n=1 Tax=Sphingomonas guangdongensis TaxID=1141890 RepID=A0A285QZ10_9SPHN|nr:hypothetical protein [Sphingomonas guangdongensis]SOB87086.1 hypothetical protein SAMN06297144_2207 [Sphingomonas guangdongensis]